MGLQPVDDCDEDSSAARPRFVVAIVVGAYGLPSETPRLLDQAGE
jgi:hypothetical protein